MQVLNINADSFKELVLDSKVPVLVDFWAPWCRPCQMMAPILEELAKDLGEKARVIKVDVENPLNSDLAREYNILSIPNMKVFKDGQIVDEFIGLSSKLELQNGLERQI